MTDAAHTVVGGRYQILASLGKGGMGLVYKAYDPVLDRTVALKKMLATIVDSDERRQRFYIEARAAARLNHPNIVTIHELEQHASDVYIVMELLEGASLASFLQHRVPMSLAGYLTILAQVADGLHYAHQRAIIHRDIKPANLVLTADGVVKILDFGIAQLASNEITKKGAMLGTPHYMAPEQARAEKIDARADLFALGAVAYELVTGVRPFTANSVAALLLKITDEPHVPVREAAPDTAPALADLIDRLLAKDRTERPANGAELRMALERIGEIDRVDLVAEAVRAVVGPGGDVTVFGPISPGLPAGVSPGPSPSPSPGVSSGPSAGAARPLSPLEALPVSSGPAIPTGLPLKPHASPVAGRRMIAEDPASFAPTPPPLAPGAPVDDTQRGHLPAPPAAMPTSPGTEASRNLPDPWAKPGRAALALDAGGIATPSGLPSPPPVAPPSAAPPASGSPPHVSGLPPVPASRPIAAPPPASARAAVPPVPSVAPREGAESDTEPDAMVPPPLPAGSVSQSMAPLPAGTQVVAAPPVLPVASAAAASLSPSQPRVDPSVPKARTRRGSGGALIAIAALFVIAFAGAGAWWYVTVRTAPDEATAVQDATQTANTATTPGTPGETASPDQTPPPGETTPSEQSTPAESTSPATVTDPNAAVAPVVPPGERTPVEQAPTEPPTPPSSTSPNGSATTPGATSTPGTPGTTSATPPVSPPGTTRAVTPPPGTTTPPRDDTRTSDTPPRVTTPPGDRTTRETPPRDNPPRETTPPRDAPPPREQTPPREAPPREAPRTTFDPEAASTFQNRGNRSSSPLYVDAPSLAAAVARIEYTLTAYSEAIERRDLDALRDVRDPISAAETALLNAGTAATVRFSDLDISVDGTDARVRARRTTVSGGRKSSATVDVTLTRRPSGWVITDIR